MSRHSDSERGHHHAAAEVVAVVAAVAVVVVVAVDAAPRLLDRPFVPADRLGLNERSS